MKRFFLLFSLQLLVSFGYSQWNSLSSPSTLQLQSIYFPIPTVGYAGGVEGTFKTTNGGANWNKIQYSGVDSLWLEGLNLQYIYASSANNIIIAGWNIWNFNEAIIKSTDGGLTWTKEFIGPANTRITSISFPTPLIGYTAGEKGRVLKTTDGGNNWSLLSTGTTTDFGAVYFTSKDTGFVGGDQILLKTVNGGATWTTTSFPLWITSFHFTNSSIGYAGSSVGSAGTIYKTADGGQTWNVQLSGAERGINSFFFINDSVGYAAAGYNNSGVIYKTSTAGKYWEPQPTSLKGASRLSIFFINDSTGISVGENGTMIKTTNQGGQVAPYAFFTSDHSIFCQDTIVTFYNGGPQNYSYYWFLNGAAAGNTLNTSLTFNANSTYTISLIASNGIYTNSISVKVITQPPLTFTLISSMQNYSVCVGGSTNLVVPASVSGVVYRLRNGTVVIGNSKNGNGSNLTFSTGTVSTTSNFNILAQKTNLCGTNSKVDNYTLVVLPLPVNLPYVYSNPSVICGLGSSGSVQIDSSEAGISYQLKKGSVNIGASISGNGGTIIFPTGPITTTTTFNILATNTLTGCNRQLSKTVVFTMENPIAGMVFSSINSEPGELVNIYNTSTNAASCQWYFGSDASIQSSSSCSSHIVSYTTTGVKTISLTVTSPSGCISSIKDTISIYDGNNLSEDCWAMAFGGNAADKGSAIAIDSSYVYVVGTYGNSGGRFNSKIGAASKLPGSGMFLTKYDQHGIIKWLTHITNSSGNSIKVAGSGNIYVTGKCISPPIFYSVDGTFINPPSNISVTGFLIKYNNSGIIQWISYFTGPFLFGNDLSIDNNENIFLVGSFSSSYKIYSASGNTISHDYFDNGVNRGFVTKFNSAGENQWFKVIANVLPVGTGLDSINNCYFVGQGYLYKYDSSGNLILSKNFPLYIEDLEVDANGNCYLAIANAGYSVIAKYNSLGILEWFNKNPSQSGAGSLGGGTAITIGSNGRIYLAGGGPFLNLPGIDDSFFLACYSSSGIIQWATRESGLVSNNQAFVSWPHALAIDKKQNCYLTGELGTFPGMPYKINKDTILSTQVEDIMLAKFDVNACLGIVLTTTVVSVGSFCSGDSIIVRFNTTGNISMQSGNIFNLELSDSAGSFFNTTYIIGVYSSTVSSATIKGTIPINIPSGIHYRVRVRSTNYAFSGSESVQNIVINSIIGGAGVDQIICNGNSIQLNATGGITYFWTPSTSLSSITISNPIAYPIITTTYIVTLTGANGCKANDSVIVFVNLLPVASAGPDVSICTGGTIKLSAKGGTNYSWLPSSGLSSSTVSNPLASPLNSTTYTVSVTKSGCTASDVIIVSVVALPVADAGSDVAICKGNFTILSGAGGISYSWSPAKGLNSITVSNPIATPTITITYTLVVYNGSCNSRDFITVNINSLPFVTLTTTTLVCANTSAFSIYGNPSGGTFSGSGVTVNTFDPAVAGIGTHTITYGYTDGNGCYGSDSKFIVVTACSGIADPLIANTLQIFPNPTNDLLNVSFFSEDMFVIRLMSPTGQLLEEEYYKKGSFNKSYDMRQYSVGLYYLQILSNKGGTIIKKIQFQ